MSQQCISTQIVTGNTYLTSEHQPRKAFGRKYESSCLLPLGLTLLTKHDEGIMKQVEHKYMDLQGFVYKITCLGNSPSPTYLCKKKDYQDLVLFAKT